MKIISKLPDFYDSALAYGHDASVTYVRHPHEVALKEVPISIGNRIEFHAYIGNKPSWRNNLSNNKLWVNTYPIVFAGKLYPVLRVNIELTFDRRESFFATSANEFWKELGARGIKNAEDDAGWQRLHRKRNSWMKAEDRPESIEGYFKRTLTEREFNWLVENCIVAMRPYLKTVVPSIDIDRGYHVFSPRSNWCWIIEPNDLRDFALPRILPPTAAFQECEMYVSGVLPRPGPAIVEITDDKVKVAKHGMDKFSFRKLPEE
jgi:hypothetical protein